MKSKTGAKTGAQSVPVAMSAKREKAFRWLVTRIITSVFAVFNGIATGTDCAPVKNI